MNELIGALIGALIGCLLVFLFFLWDRRKWK